MNYSVIKLARERYEKYDKAYCALINQINLHLFTLSHTNLGETEKNKVLRGLIEHSENIIGGAEEALNELDNTRFSESDFALQEERNYLAKQYEKLINSLRQERAAILREIKKEMIPVKPMWKKDLKVGYCYFCDISIANGFPYRLGEEEQKVLDIKVVEGAEFCSQECLSGYCKEYKNWDKLRQTEEKKNKEKIEEDKRLLTEAQTRLAMLQKKINELEKKEREIGILQREGIYVSEAKKPSIWQRFWQKLGIAKEDNSLSNLENIKKKKATLQTQLTSAEKKVQKCIITLTVDQQVEQERKRLEKRLLQKKERLIASKEEEN